MKEYLLKEIANVKNGYAFDSSKYSDKGIPIIRIADIKDNIDLSKCVCIDEEINKEFLIKKGSLLIALSGATTGKMGVFSDNKIAYLNQRICSIYTKNKDISQEFLIYFLKSIQKKIIVNSYGGAQPNISSRWIENIKIKVPNIEIQKKISKKLELLENNIDSRKKQLNYLKELVKSLFIKFNENGVEKQLDEVADIIMGQSPLSQSYNKERKGLPFYQGKTEFTNIYIKEATVYCNFPIKIAEKNDILISVRAPVGNVNIATQKSCIGRGLASIRPKKVNYLYLFYLLKEQKLNFEKMGVGSTFKAINKNNISSLKISIVGKDKQDKIMEYLLLIEKLSFNFSNVTFFGILNNKREVA